MNITQATERACEEPTLLDALAYICVWESERAIKQAKEGLRDAEGKGWNTFFKICLKSVMEKYDTSGELTRCRGCGRQTHLPLCSECTNKIKWELIDALGLDGAIDAVRQSLGS